MTRYLGIDSSVIASATESTRENLLQIGTKLSEHKPNKFVCGILVGVISIHLFYKVHSRIFKKREPVKSVSNVCTQCTSSSEPVEEQSDLEVVSSEKVITTPRRHCPRRRLRTRSAGNGQYCFTTERPRIIVIS